MPHNFSADDFRASLLAFVLFGLFAFVPGWVLAWTADLLDFRKRRVLARVAIAIPLSIGVTPALAYMAGRYFPFAGVWWTFGLLWLAFPAVLYLDLRAVAGLRRAPPRLWLYTAVAGFWLALGLLSLIDLQLGNRLYFPVIGYDYALRTPIVASIAHTGIPPANPMFFPSHHAVPLRYHYFWLIPCALVDLLGGTLVSARQANIGGTLWCGLALMGIVAAFLRFVHPSGPARIHRRVMIGIGLLCVTGLDILPNLLLDSLHHPLADPEWWNEQVSAWITSVLWVPHATASLIAGLAGALIIWSFTLAASTWKRVTWAALAALCLASCIGSSVYVSLVLAAGLCAWVCILLMHRAWGEAAFTAAAGAAAACFIAPHLLFLAGLAAGSATGAGSAGAAVTTPPIVFGIRRFSFILPFLDAAHASPLATKLYYLLSLPLNYLMELGAFLAAGIWTLRHWRANRKHGDRYRAFTAALAGASLVICTFFRSAVISNNDLGARGFLLCQFILLIWMVDLMEQVPFRRRMFVNTLIVIGVAGSIYEAATLRVFNIALDRSNIPRQDWSADYNLGRRTFALRAAYEDLRGKLPATAIVQHNPNRAPNDLPWGLYADRPVAADTPWCDVVFGGDPQACASVQARLKPIFAGEAAPAEVDRTCHDLSISAVLVKDTDPAWKDRESWVWQRHAIVSENEFVRVLPCGTGPANP